MNVKRSDQVSNKKLILVVDDNAMNLKMLGSILKANGLSPAIAQSGANALKSIKRKLPDLILLDVMMPDMDGFEVCKRLKQDVDTQDIPVIFLTAKTEQEDIIQGLEVGAVDYVTKPFNPKELMTRVNTHLELKAAKEGLKQALATKDKFFSIISHDLINLFNALLGLSFLLTDPNMKLGAAEKEDYIQSILKSSRQGYDLLKNLLEWSRSQTGTLKVTPAILNLSQIVDLNIAFLNEHAKNKHINIFSSIEETSLVFADENMLDTVLRNLLANAIKFTPENGQVEISAKQAQENLVEISISDTGVGIKPENIHKLFRSDVSYTTFGTHKEKGTGLGLILCKEFVEKNGGTIGVKSQEGKGSRFYIRLPCQDNHSTIKND
ncbi:MAG: hybrid sensor histidine kinase/response regulator [Candidatus Parabeggiatoa sp. nov. 3]|nr:MAG: hybrid sensor histidine kinase/response regulator [Gammaproteobacteria bacterium]RKZ66027.1 MAG: hybrid sensor histidine kinase/response regulator [Gammaproteobacteria bacterium]RKZ83443.1 MAG: hybrid sensor histidine kinase/response regulator [Gammaproteobacteria bacterium]